MAFKQFLKELNGSRVEGELLKTSFISLMASFLVLSIVYFLFLRGSDIGNKLFFIFMSLLSYALILPVVRQIRAYPYLSCSTGMMVGMTIGMVAGFLPSFYLASTNGMFYGSVWGIILGVLFGFYNGKSCGIMGVMEGIMAGFMGGLMGAMTAIMLLNDHLVYMALIVFIVCAIIVGGLNYLVYSEMSTKLTKREGYGFIVISNLVLTILTILLTLVGPKGGIFS